MPDFQKVRRGVREFTEPALIELLRLPEDAIIAGCSWNPENECLVVGYRSEDLGSTIEVMELQYVSPNQGNGYSGTITKAQIDCGRYPYKKVTDDA